MGRATGLATVPGVEITAIRASYGDPASPPSSGVARPEDLTRKPRHLLTVARPYRNLTGFLRASAHLDHNPRFTSAQGDHFPLRPRQGRDSAAVRVAAAVQDHRVVRERDRRG